MARPRPHGERVDVRPACGGCQGVLSCCVPRYSVLGITGATCHSALQRHPRPAVDCSRVWAPARGDAAWCWAVGGALDAARPRGTGCLTHIQPLLDE